MTLEATLDRIAVALEKIAAGGQLAATQQVAVPEKATGTEGGQKVRQIREAKAETQPPKETQKEDDGLGGSEAQAKAAPTFQEMKDALVGVKAKFGPEASKTIMTSVGANAVTEIKVEHFAAVVAACNKKMGYT